MNSALQALKLSACVFGLIGVAHFLMLVGGSRMSVGNLEIGAAWSLPVCLAMVVLSWWIHQQVLALLKEHGRGKAPPPAPAFWP